MNHYIEVVNGRYYVYTLGRGTAHISVGPGWPTPREAARYADSLDTPFVSPLRSSGEGLPAVESNALDSPPSRVGGALTGRSKGRPRRRRAP